MNRPLRLKLGLLTLLLLNAVAFLWRGEYNDSFDSMAWIVLMILYEIESGKTGELKLPFQRLDWTRKGAVSVVVIAELSYLYEGAWLDGVYSLLWLLVVALFEFESRFKSKVTEHPLLFRGAGLCLIVGMIGVIWAWVLERSYFNAYDGVIWSLAFLIIDLDLMASALDQRDSPTNPD